MDCGQNLKATLQCFFFLENKLFEKVKYAGHIYRYIDRYISITSSTGPNFLITESRPQVIVSVNEIHEITIIFLIGKRIITKYMPAQYTFIPIHLHLSKNKTNPLFFILESTIYCEAIFFF